MKTMKCNICLNEKSLKTFSRSFSKGKYYGYRKTCNKCIYDKYCRGKKYGKRFKWKTATLEEKKIHTLKIIEKNTKKDGECILWINPVRKGYGAMRYEGRFAVSHRVSWIINNGPIEKGLYVLHKCDKPSCVNISHLFLGSAKDNWHDMQKKGRNIVNRGAKCNFAKLNENQVREIKKRIISGESDTSLGYHFSVSAGTIADIRRGKNWKHVII